MNHAPALVALVACAVGAPCNAQAPVAAVWQPRKVSFTYESDVAVYSCDALARRVASILRAIGARDDIKVRASHCSATALPVDSHLNDPGRFGTADPLAKRRLSPRRRQSAVVRAEFMLPTEITPDVAAELERDKSRRELVSHVTGDPLPRFSDPVKFAAQRQQVTLSHATLELVPEECELLEQMSSSVFRRLDVAVVRASSSCDRDRASRLPPEMVVEALLVAPADARVAPGQAAPEPKPESPAGPGEEPSAPGDDCTPQ